MRTKSACPGCPLDAGVGADAQPQGGQRRRPWQGPQQLPITSKAVERKRGVGAGPLEGPPGDPLGCHQVLAGRGNVFAFTESEGKGSTARPASFCQSLGAGGEQNPFFPPPGPRTLCQVQSLVGSFPALLAPGGAAIRAARGPLRRGPE